MKVQIWPYVDEGSRTWLNAQAKAIEGTAGSVIDVLVADAMRRGVALQRQAPDVRLVEGGDASAGIVASAMPPEP